MKKRFILFLMVFLLCIAVFPTTAFAKGNLEGVDYDRIIDEAGSHRATLTLGELEFNGELTKGNGLTDEEKDKIIKTVMNDMEITSGMLLNAESLIKAAKTVKGFGMGDVINAAAKLSGTSDLLSIYNYFMGTGKDPVTIARDITKGQITDAGKDAVEKGLENALTDGGKVALKGAGKFAYKLLFILPDLFEIGVDALTKYENIKYTVTLGTERLVLLEAFYKECNERIKDASEDEEGEESEWEIRFNKDVTQTYNCTFWGVSGVMMEASLSGVLKQISEIDGAAGQYRGTLTLEIEGVDMASFDSSVHNTVPFSNFYSVYSSAGNVRGQSFTNEKKPTELTRKMHGEISVMITGGSGTQNSEISGSLTSGSDETVFSFYQYWTMSSSQFGIMQFVRWTSSDPSTLDGAGKDGTSAFARDIGTVWRPLESKPVITVYY